MKKEKREFVFEIKEIKSRFNPNYKDNKEEYILSTTGTVIVNGDDIFVTVDDLMQPHGIFEVKDSFFKRIIKKIHDVTK